MAHTKQPAAQGKLIGSVEGTREWSSQVSDCFSDLNTCIPTMFCLPCTMCKLSTRVGDWVCMPFCVPGGLVALRARIRTLGGIKGTICDDCLLMYFCGPCGICQMGRELEHMGL